ncbi:MAG: FKBP-type peptidyl-prolyl cis-trans isomerase [Candidatus Microsaccharimonas sp.]
MAASKKQRIGIWIIAVFMAIGSIGSFVIIILANQNSASDQARFTQLYGEYQTATKEYQAKVDAQSKELSDQYYTTFSQYQSRPASFDASAVTELKKDDIVVGSGDELNSQSTFTAYYIGWKPDGTVFDSSIADGALKEPITATPGGVIKGWTDGAVGMKVGGVRELTIPADLAYGSTGSGDSIPADTPLKFIIMVIPTPETIPQPEVPTELTELYGRLYGQQ